MSVLVGMLISALVLGLSLGMLLGLKIQLLDSRRPAPAHRAPRPIPVVRPAAPAHMSETRIEHPLAATSGLREIRTFM